MRWRRTLPLAGALAVWAAGGVAAEPLRPAPPGAAAPGRRTTGTLAEPASEGEPERGEPDDGLDPGDDDLDGEEASPPEPRLRAPRPAPRGEGEEEPPPPGDVAPLPSGPAEPAKAAAPLSPG
jgi:hypothetical protein